MNLELQITNEELAREARDISRIAERQKRLQRLARARPMTPNFCNYFLGFYLNKNRLSVAKSYRLAVDKCGPVMTLSQARYMVKKIDQRFIEAARGLGDMDTSKQTGHCADQHRCDQAKDTEKVHEELVAPQRRREV